MRGVSRREWYYDGPEFHGQMPTAETVCRTAVAMARTEKGLCGLCAEPVNEDGECVSAQCKEGQ